MSGMVPVKAKPMLASKLNWIGILTALAGASQLVDVLQLPDPWSKILLVVAGTATVILRTFFTTQPVSTSPTKPETQYVEKGTP